MNVFQVDLNEIEAILLALYPSSDKADLGAEKVLSKMSVITDEDYLNNRMTYIKSHADNSQILKSGLSEIFNDYCKSNECTECPVCKYCNSYIMERRQSFDHSAPVMIDLFCGAGGLSLGFTQEGFITSLANDIEPCCIDTYSHNHPDLPRKYIVLGDIQNVVNDIKSLMRFQNVDVIVGGPPCQGFSMANRQRLINDPRNQLYKNYVKAVELVQPRFFVMENVKGMLSVASQVVEDFETIGYNVSYRVLNAKDFGVPQNRERLIYIGNRIGADNSVILDEISSLSSSIPHSVLADAIEGLRPLEASRKKNDTESNSVQSGGKIEKSTSINANSYITYINQGRKYPLTFNHKARYNNDRDIEIYGRMLPGDKSDDPKIADIMPYKSRNNIFKDKYFKLEPSKICKTITAHMKFDCNMYIHPSQARGLTPRESARIQSYPDDYFFRGSYTKTYMQIGNSVPPLLGRAIASIIKKHLKGEK
ncbi:MAG: DNA cytosine methyltransferase [Ruminococcus flavefaciens]|nr:DNA cytosine methyltransferase [Ruminococcus flavefaciens]